MNPNQQSGQDPAQRPPPQGQEQGQQPVQQGQQADGQQQTQMAGRARVAGLWPRTNRDGSIRTSGKVENDLFIPAGSWLTVFRNDYYKEGSKQPTGHVHVEFAEGGTVDGENPAVFEERRKAQRSNGASPAPAGGNPLDGIMSPGAAAAPAAGAAAADAGQAQGQDPSRMQGNPSSGQAPQGQQGQQEADDGADIPF